MQHRSNPTGTSSRIDRSPGNPYDSPVQDSPSIYHVFTIKEPSQTQAHHGITLDVLARAANNTKSNNTANVDSVRSGDQRPLQISKNVTFERRDELHTTHERPKREAAVTSEKRSREMLENQETQPTSNEENESECVHYNRRGRTDAADADLQQPNAAGGSRRTPRQKIVTKVYELKKNMQIDVHVWLWNLATVDTDPEGTNRKIKITLSHDWNEVKKGATWEKVNIGKRSHGHFVMDLKEVMSALNLDHKLHSIQFNAKKEAKVVEFCIITNQRNEGACEQERPCATLPANPSPRPASTAIDARASPQPVGAAVEAAVEAAVVPDTTPDFHSSENRELPIQPAQPQAINPIPSVRIQHSEPIPPIQIHIIIEHRSDFS